VLVQLEHLHTLPVIASRLSRGRVHLHGWMYKIETGQMFAFDPEVRQFVPFAANKGTVPKGMGANGKATNGDVPSSPKAKRAAKPPAKNRR
jgi:hypothetical protein